MIVHCGVRKNLLSIVFEGLLEDISIEKVPGAVEERKVSSFHLNKSRKLKALLCPGRCVINIEIIRHQYIKLLLMH